MEIKRILLDLDGVVTNFFNPSLELHGRRDLIESWPLGVWDAEEVLGLTLKEFLFPIHQIGSDFWSNLETFPHSNELWRICNEFAKTYICTAQTECGSSAHGKIKFVQRWFSELGCPEKDADIIITKRKYLLAMPGVVLIDDRDKNCFDFIEHGGQAILFPYCTNKNANKDPLTYVKEQLQEIKNA